MLNNYMQGMQGPQGTPGVQGNQGLQGVAGPQGTIGSQGIQGASGAQGPKGDPGTPAPSPVPTPVPTPVPVPVTSSYASVYASVAQTIAAYNVPALKDQVLFDKQNAVSAGDFDLSQMGVTGDIKVLKHGIYHLAWQLQARITAPVPSPVPSWSFGFWLNGVLVPGSIYSGFTQAPTDDACHSTGDLIIELKAGDLLRLRNASASPASLNPSVTGSMFPITIASINIESLKLLP